MLRSTLAAATCLALLAGGVAAAAPTADPAEVFVPAAGPVLPLEAYLPAGPTTPADVGTAWRRQQVAALARAGVDPQVLEAAQAAGRPAVRARQVAPPLDGEVVVEESVDLFFAALGLTAAGDLDGDRRTDVLDVRYAPARDGGTTLRVVARRASDGRVLWQRRLGVPKDHIGFVVPAAVGSPGRPGVLLYDLGFSGDDGRVTVSVGLFGLSGRTGATAWRHTSRGVVDLEDRTERSVPSLAGQLEGGAASQVLLGLADSTTTSSLLGQRTSGSVQPLVVDGADGTARRLGAPLSREDARPLVRGVPDLSGDGRDDVALLAAGKDSVVTLRRTSDGGDGWSTSGLPLHGGADVHPTGRVTAGSVPDLAVSTGRPASSSSVLPSQQPSPAQVVLLRGSDGEEQTRVPGDQPVDVGRVGRTPVLGVAAFGQRSSEGRSSASLRVAAHEAGGRTVYDRSYEVSTTEREGEEESGGSFVFAFPAGDLGRDGAQELQAFLAVFSGDRQATRRLLLDGATGTEVRRGGDPLYGSLSSHGDDLVTVTPGKGVLVTGRSGRTGRPVWSTRLAPGTAFDGGFASTADTSSGPCDDVAVLAGSRRHDYAALLSNTGRLRWSLLGRSGSDDVRPVVRGSSGTDRCS